MYKKKRTHYLYRHLFIVIIIILSILGICLSFECYYFYAHVKELCELKEDYNRYAAALKKIMRDYNKTKEQLDLLESDLEHQKKKELARLESGKKDNEFLLINRELSYLKASALKYILHVYYSDLFYRISEDEWMKYTDAIYSADEDKNNGVDDIISRTASLKRNKEQAGKSSSQHSRPKIKKNQTKNISISSDISFIWPVDRSKCWLSSLFGSRTKSNGLPGFHYGLDMAAFRGTPVKAVFDGIVMEARYSRGYGKTVLISHNKKYKTRYAHLDKIHVYVGQKVCQGYVIGLVGATGNVRTTGKDGSHLHFEVYNFNQRVNPLYFLMG